MKTFHEVAKLLYYAKNFPDFESKWEQNQHYSATTLRRSMWEDGHKQKRRGLFQQLEEVRKLSISLTVAVTVIRG